MLLQLGPYVPTGALSLLIVVQSIIKVHSGMAIFVHRDRPDTPDVQALLQTHLRFASTVTPGDSGHALDSSALCADTIHFWTARQNGIAVGCVALKALSRTAGEVKSLHVLQAHRGQGIAVKLMAVLEAEALARGYARLVLETGKNEAFAPSRHLYAKLGFQPCPSFGAYEADPFSFCMEKRL